MVNLFDTPAEAKFIQTYTPMNFDGLKELVKNARDDMHKNIDAINEANANVGSIKTPFSPWSDKFNENTFNKVAGISEGVSHADLTNPGAYLGIVNQTNRIKADVDAQQEIANRAIETAKNLGTNNMSAEEWHAYGNAYIALGEDGSILNPGILEGANLNNLNETIFKGANIINEDGNAVSYGNMIKNLKYIEKEKVDGYARDLANTDNMNLEFGLKFRESIFNAMGGQYSEDAYNKLVESGNPLAKAFDIKTGNIDYSSEAFKTYKEDYIKSVFGLTTFKSETGSAASGKDRPPTSDGPERTFLTDSWNRMNSRNSKAATALNGGPERDPFGSEYIGSKEDRARDVAAYYNTVCRNAFTAAGYSGAGNFSQTTNAQMISSIVNDTGETVNLDPNQTESIVNRFGGTLAKVSSSSSSSIGDSSNKDTKTNTVSGLRAYIRNESFDASRALAVVDGLPLGHVGSISEETMNVIMEQGGVDVINRVFYFAKDATTKTSDKSRLGLRLIASAYTTHQSTAGVDNTGTSYTIGNSVSITNQQNNQVVGIPMEIKFSNADKLDVFKTALYEYIKGYDFDAGKSRFNPNETQISIIESLDKAFSSVVNKNDLIRYFKDDLTTTTKVNGKMVETLNPNSEFATHFNAISSMNAKMVINTDDSEYTRQAFDQAARELDKRENMVKNAYGKESANNRNK